MASAPDMDKLSSISARMNSPPSVTTPICSTHSTSPTRVATTLSEFSDGSARLPDVLVALGEEIATLDAVEV